MNNQQPKQPSASPSAPTTPPPMPMLSPRPLMGPVSQEQFATIRDHVMLRYLGRHEHVSVSATVLLLLLVELDVRRDGNNPSPELYARVKSTIEERVQNAQVSAQANPSTR